MCGLMTGGLAESRADTIVAVSASQTISPGIPADELELEELGIDPNLFLFTGNTMYGNNGVAQLEIIADNVDPSSAASLNSSATQTLITLDDSGNVVGVSGSSLNGNSMTVESQASSSVPEPSTGLLFITGLLLVAVGFRRATKAPAPHVAQASNVAPASNRDL
jgi:hypothetical protein